MDFPSDNRVIIWNNRGIPIHRLIHESTIYDISSFSDDNSLILTMTEDAILLWDVLKGTIIEKMAKKVQIRAIIAKSEAFLVIFGVKWVIFCFLSV
jgi:WD40 repeat protein